jgi:molybdopterin synthase catalytic subunit
LIPDDRKLDRFARPDIDGASWSLWPSDVDDRSWVGLLSGEIPVAEVQAWAARPECGAVVSFMGTVRDHSAGRPGVTHLEYEVYQPLALLRMSQVATSARARWPAVACLSLLHRVGRLEVGEVSVLSLASSPHRYDAFDAARYCIDTIKRSVPIWKRETWSGITDWSVCTHGMEDIR